jgi:hypothetical protein
MSSVTLKIICSLAALFGAYMLFFLLSAFGQGVFAPFDSGTVALKVGGTLVRAAFLFLCAWSAWRQPHAGAWFAWGAFFTFVFAGAADEVFRLGLVRGLGHLIPVYYITASVQALFAIAVWLLSAKTKPIVAGG